MSKKKTVTPKEKVKKDSGQQEVTLTGLAGTIQTVELKLVRPNAYNYNQQSRFIFDKTKASIKRYGFIDPIVVRSGDDTGTKYGYYEIIGGEHRLRAAEELGYKEIPVNDLGNMSDAHAKALCIILNETKGKADPDALASLISDISLSAVDDIISTLPYDEAEIDAFIESVSVDMDDDDMGGEDIDIDESTTPSLSKEKTVIGLLGLLNISKKKEEYLITRIESALSLTNTESKPLRCLEIMLELIDEAYSN